MWHWAGALGPVLVAGDAAALCAAGVALGHIHLRFAWQAWHLVTSTFVLRGKRGPYGTGLALVSHAIFVTHHLSHTTLSHTIFHTPSLTLFQDSFTHHLCHTTCFTHYLSHTLFHTQLCHTQLCHTPPLTHHLSHTTLSHTIFVTQHLSHTIFHTPSLTPNFVTHLL